MDMYHKRLCKSSDFVQYKSLSDFETEKMQLLGERTVLHRLLQL